MFFKRHTLYSEPRPGPRPSEKGDPRALGKAELIPKFIFDKFKC